MSPYNDDHQGHEPGRVSRRLFLKGSGATIAAVGVGGSIASEVAAQATPAASPMPMPASSTAAATAVQFFNSSEAELVDAITARIIPGSASDPGAREAGVVFYIDRSLGGSNEGYFFKTYKQGPFLEVTEAEVPVEASSRTDLYRTISVAADESARYGYQSMLPPQELYRRGLAAVNAYAQSKFGNAFTKLSESQQDQILTDMEANKATGFDGPSASQFFTRLRNDTIEGMFSDPMYGGNRSMAGWKLIGYPGARGFYTSKDLANTAFKVAPISLSDMINQ